MVDQRREDKKTKTANAIVSKGEKDKSLAQPEQRTKLALKQIGIDRQENRLNEEKIDQNENEQKVKKSKHSRLED